MKQALKEAMTASISEVLETMFFMTIEIKDADAPEMPVSEPGETLLISGIDFKGKVTGGFYLVVPEGILRSMTETFMGLAAEEVMQSHLNGTVLEAINMIAGNTFSKLDKTAVFELGIPTLTDIHSVFNGCPAQAPETHFLMVETFAGNIGLKVCYTVE